MKRLPEKETAQTEQDILKALEKTGWNKAKAARLLGISRPTLYKKIEKYRLIMPTEKA